MYYSYRPTAVMLINLIHIYLNCWGFERTMQIAIKILCIIKATYASIPFQVVLLVYMSTSGFTVSIQTKLLSVTMGRKSYDINSSNDYQWLLPILCICMHIYRLSQGPTMPVTCVAVQPLTLVTETQGWPTKSQWTSEWVHRCAQVLPLTI